MAQLPESKASERGRLSKKIEDPHVRAVPSILVERYREKEKQR